MRLWIDFLKVQEHESLHITAQSTRLEKTYPAVYNKLRFSPPGGEIKPFGGLDWRKKKNATLNRFSELPGARSLHISAQSTRLEKTYSAVYNKLRFSPPGGEIKPFGGLDSRKKKMRLWIDFLKFLEHESLHISAESIRLEKNYPAVYNKLRFSPPGGEIKPFGGLDLRKKKKKCVFESIFWSSRSTKSFISVPNRLASKRPIQRYIISWGFLHQVAR